MGSGPAVLVTGAAGYVGRLCVAALAQRLDELSVLVALDWTEVDASERIDGVVYEQGDICDHALKDLFRRHGIDTVVHLASIVRAPKGAPSDLAYRVDVLGTKNILEACEDSSATRLIVTSSGAAYGYHPDNPEWLDENDPLRGNDEFEYSKNKRLVEAMLAQWREERPELQQVVFRPGTVVGRMCTVPSRTSSRNPSCWASLGRNRPLCSFGIKTSSRVSSTRSSPTRSVFTTRRAMAR